MYFVLLSQITRLRYISTQLSKFDRILPSKKIHWVLRYLHFCAARGSVIVTISVAQGMQSIQTISANAHKGNHNRLWTEYKGINTENRLPFWTYITIYNAPIKSDMKFIAGK